MRLTTILCTGILSSVAGVSLACDLPKLVAIPPKDQIAGKEAEVRVAATQYFQAMSAYTECVKVELTTAGGDSAPDVLKRVLVSRNNTAVAEAEFMMKLFTDNVGPLAPAGPVAPAN
jgi:hypothetical protein